MKPIVRPLAIRDKQRWLGLFQGYIEFYRATVPDSVIEQTFNQLIAAEHMVGLIAATADDEPVGLAHLVFHASTWSQSVYCYLEDLFVDPARRGTGVARALIETSYACADARNATRTYWATAEDNTAARALYDKIATRAPFVQYRR